MLQLQEAYNAFTRLKKDTSDVSVDLVLDWFNNIHWFVWDYLSGTDSKRLIKTAIISVTAGTTTYTLPVDFKNTLSFGCGIFLSDSNGNPTDTVLSVTDYASSAQGYYFEGSNIIFTPSVTQNHVYYLRYIPTPPIFTALTEYFSTDKTLGGKETIPLEFRKFVVMALDAEYTAWDEEPTAEGMADQRYIRVMNELCKHIRKSPGVYGLSSLAGNF
jgi:hypothetical protein